MDPHDPWGVLSLSLTLYDDLWRVKKVLTEDDTSIKNGLVLRKKVVAEMLLPVLGENDERDAQTADGAELWFWDIDTQSLHQLFLKKEASSGPYKITRRWNQEFNKRRKLQANDEIGLQWDRDNVHFNFSVIKRAD
ncbi:hypothetical protein QN277_001750 [Acacia crassicarpa]|uniref:TF-B3 domain-containing protein n=1 Tax=Acacia crassicarpa TaxID=499986 RepID=A0AAE1N947_9FABA|nr:hypothetical protein QN277_001750 [Acacia crassicarpa]